MWYGGFAPFKANMNIEEIITVLQNKVKSLENARNSTLANGEMNMLAQIDIEILNTQSSLDKILTLK
jgi:hypothetical protein